MSGNVEMPPFEQAYHVTTATGTPPSATMLQTLDPASWRSEANGWLDNGNFAEHYRTAFDRLPPDQQSALTQRDAFRGFMTSHRLRATQWAKQAGIPAAELYAYLTGRSRALKPDAFERLARAAQVRVEDMFK